MTTLNKGELIARLSEQNIDFPRSASVMQLRRLYDEHFPAPMMSGVTVDDSDDNSPSDTPSIPIVNPASSDTLPAPLSIPENFTKLPTPGRTVLTTEERCQELYSEENALDAELRILEKKRRIQLLRAEISAEAADIPTYVQPPPSFKDIKHSVPPFAGTDSYDATKWLSDFERACDSVNGDRTFRLKSIRRLMKPETEAEWFLRTDNSATYDEFRANFLSNFGHVYTMSEVMDKMKKNTFAVSKLSVMGYILQMQELAARANIDDVQTIRFIIDGFRDRTANIAILYPATTMAQLKSLSHRYMQLREISGNPSTPVCRNSLEMPTKIPAKPTSSVPNSALVPKNSPTRCFNCSGLGHISARCPEPKRQHGSCFRCGSIQHNVRNCPKPAPQNANMVALIDDFRNLNTDVNEAESDRVPELNPVSVAFPSDCVVSQCNTFPSLFDTGSPISLIQYSSVPNQLVNSTIESTRYSGLGCFRLCTFGRISVNITFRRITKSIVIFVVPDVYLPHPLLLGRNFLHAFRIRLTIEPNIVLPKINYDAKEQNKLFICNKVLHCVYDTVGINSVTNTGCPLCMSATTPKLNLPSENISADAFDVLKICLLDRDEAFRPVPYSVNPLLNPFHIDSIHKIFREHYFDLTNIPKAKHDYVMKIKLTSDIPISSTPRCLSYADKKLVEEHIDELLVKGFIRPSNSPYSFPIVLPPKKDGSKRMCVDYKPLNRIMVRECFPLPHIDDCIEKLESKRYFTTLDLKNGFHHVRMDSESVPYTSFVTPFGQYEYLVLPFGLKTGPSVFQRFIVHVLREFIRDGSVIVFMDDITLATETIPQHFELLSRVLHRLAEFRLELKMSKCKICYSESELLSYTITKEGLKPSQRHLENICHLPIPTNVYSLYS